MSAPLGKWMRWLTGDRSSGASVVVAEQDTEYVVQNTVVANQEPSAVDGFAMLVDGRVMVTDPEYLGAYPVLSVPKSKSVKVLIDGEVAVGDCVITSSSVVQFRFNHESPQVSYRTSVSADKLAVTLEAVITPGVNYSVRDSESTRKLIVRIRQEQVMPKYDAHTAERLIHMLEEQDFHGVIDYDAVHEVAQATQSCARVVLVGTPPFPGRAGSYKRVTLPTEVDKYLGKVQLATVSVGFCVGYYEPEVAGVAGQDVYGREIPVRIVSSKPVLGSGVIAVNGNIVATRSGRVVFTKRLIDVVPERVIHGDVTARDGRITFDGNVVVYGSVCDGSYIRCGGTVTVKGGVFHSTIIGEKGVHVADNVVNSFIWSGFTSLEYTALASTIQGLLKALQQFHREYELLVEQAEKRFNAQVLLPRIAAVLFEQRHESLARQLQTIINNCSTELYDADATYSDFVDLLRTRWQGIQLISVSVDDTVHLIHRLESYLSEIELALTADPAPVVVKNVTSGSIRATGNIMVRLGMHSATLESRGHVTIQGSARGGFIVSDKTSRVRELGSSMGVETSVRVSDPNGLIIAGTCHANALLEVCGYRHRTLYTERNIRFGREQHVLKGVSNG